MDDLCKLPKNMKYKIAMQLSLLDLKNLCLTNKRCAELCMDDNFWKSKTLNEYGDYTFKKPDDITYRQFYKRLINSGQLQIAINSKFEYLADNVYKYIPGFFDEYYVTDIGDLCTIRSGNWNDSDLMVHIKGKFSKSVSKIREKYRLMPNVQDIAFTENGKNENGAMILLLNHTVLTIGQYLNGIMDRRDFLFEKNIKSVGGFNGYNFYYFVTDKDELYIYDGETELPSDKPARPKFIADNIKQVVLNEISLADGSLTEIYYTTKDLNLYKLKVDIYYQNQNIDKSEIELSDIREGPYQVTRKLEKLKFTSVKNFAISGKYLFIIHNGKLYAYDNFNYMKKPILINTDNHILKIVCDNNKIAFIDIENNLYVMGEWIAGLYGLKLLPEEYTLDPIFVTNDVLNVDIKENFVIIKKSLPPRKID